MKLARLIVGHLLRGRRPVETAFDRRLGALCAVSFPARAGVAVFRGRR
jgi:hypothetical protein